MLLNISIGIRDNDPKAQENKLQYYYLLCIKKHIVNYILYDHATALLKIWICQVLFMTLPIKCQCCPYIETSQLICTANELTGFYMRTRLALNGLILSQFTQMCTGSFRVPEIIEIKVVISLK